MGDERKGPAPSTVAEHLAGTKDGWHGKITRDGVFKPEEGRYRLYIELDFLPLAARIASHFTVCDPKQGKVYCLFSTSFIGLLMKNGEWAMSVDIGDPGLFCPFAHRANLVRHLKKLETAIPLTVVRPYPKGHENGWPGWKFPADTEEYPGATPDPLYHSEYMHELYFKADAGYKGRYSVPVLWDTKTETIVNNESTELVRDLATAFHGVAGDDELDFYPERLRGRIDEVCEWMQRDLNTGVYKAGFADGQEMYDENVLPVFAALNKLEKLIAENGGPFVLGKELTEVDLRLYPTVIRFDAVYVQHFKCNLGTIRHDYPSINNWMKGLFYGLAKLPNGNRVYGFGEVDLDAVKDGQGAEEKGTVDFKHIKENYTKSHTDINPKRITPRGPWPNVEPGYEVDYSKVRVGGVHMPEVIELEKKLP